MSRTLLCRADEIPEGSGRGFRLGSGTEQVAVFVVRTAGVLRGYVNSCPHIGTPLDWLPDRFFDKSGEHLLCGTHGALFRPEDGLCVRGPCVGMRLLPATIAVEDGAIVLDLMSHENS
ncbi:MAG TPA: Rieske (2Fe-2S) protein [Stellaceae bacterium]|nr:Rieske (2Fe-2S) protein [Stellaceae bacterium]